MKKLKPTSSRICALEILSELEQGKVRVNDLLHKRLGKLDPVDRALATRLVMGVLRLRGQLDYYWEAHSKRPVSQVDSVVTNILRLGVYQHVYCDGITAYALVNESVLLSRHKGRKYASGFVNAVLRSLTKAPPPPLPDPTSADSLIILAKLLSHPKWLIKRWIDRFGLAEIVKLCQFNNAEPAHFVRVNTILTTKKELIKYFCDIGWDPQPVAGIPEAFRISPSGNPTLDPGYKKGWYEIQALSSMMAGYIMAPKPGETVLDACAGRGGKSTHLAEMMQGRGVVIAGDIRAAKLRLLQDNLRRLKVEIVHPMGYNGTSASFKENFDRILLDAPCSSLGVTGRYPDIKWKVTEQDVNTSGRLQRPLLSQLSQFVKPGGFIVYAVCSFEPEETEDIIEDFLSGHNRYERESIRDHLPKILQESVTQSGYWLPQNSGMDGFFCAMLRKSQ